MGYRPRQIQQQMAVAVADAVNSKAPLVVEAGTGVGKTFAYLLPSLLSGKQVIISTAVKSTKRCYKDLPELMAILGIAPKIALLKGRRNYLCQHLLQQQLQATDSIDAQVFDDLLRIHQWSIQTKDGDVGGLAIVRNL